ncbi:hypothetical protein ABE902_13235 [Enterococcus casseliflavus]|uniref:hypothetical protein n=1 Tax=Enterococcus casseliflavus TaxID=37734 RepID=UPI003D6B4905
MSDTINEIGIISVLQEKNVIFKRRDLKKIVISNGSVNIEYEKTSNEDFIMCSCAVDYRFFEEKVERLIWQLIDDTAK